MATKISAADAKALVRAIKLEPFPKVKALCAKGSVDVEVAGSHGKTTTLFAAVSSGQAELAKLVLAAGGSVDGEMKGPKKLGELLSYWGNGIAHYLVKQSNLEAKKLDKVVAEVTYT